MSFRDECRAALDSNGALVLPDFLSPTAIDAVLSDALQQQHLAYFCEQKHNVFLTESEPSLPPDHARNRTVSSSKGCITDDQLPSESVLRALYKSQDFRHFLCSVLGEESLHEYSDPLSSINIHYASEGQELGWHFDNSSFATTLMIQSPSAGGVFEYIRDFRDAGIVELLNGVGEPNSLVMNPGALVLFRGRNAIHRVTPVEGDRVRILAVLAYNSKPNISLSEPARMTFYGRLR